MTSVLLAHQGVDADELHDDLVAAGYAVAGRCAGAHLVREAVRLAPDLVVCWVPVPDAEFFAALRLLQAAQPMPVLAFTQDLRAEAMEQALACGVQAWVVSGYGAKRLRPLVQLTLARARTELAQRAELEDLRRRYEERKLVDRAKGLLMRSRQVSEDEAFRLLRSASMQGKLRVGQLSQQLIDAAQYAQATNRAGRLRMLSQRIVKLWALLLAVVEAPAARALLADSRQQVEQILRELGQDLSRPSFGDLLEAASQSWAAMRTALDAPLNAANLQTLDVHGEALLAQAERLTASLAAAGPMPTLQVVNIAGRQRMLSQRLAKLALLRSLLPTGAGAGAAQPGLEETVRQFDEGMVRLREAPLSSAAIRDALAAAESAWQEMQRGTQQPGSRGGRVALASASEALLEELDHLTLAYEHSLQVLMG